ncbi:MAG: gamma-glutamyltransferase family protein [Pseudomonadota bacterium]
MRDFQMPGRSTVYATNAMCATSHPLASATAIDILKSGGNATDAAIAAAVLLGICEPQMTGLGGDLFALVQPGPGADIVAINASGRAPQAASADALRAAGLDAMPRDQPAAVTIPGAVDGFCALSERFGKIGLDRCLAPAIHYAEEGVPVAPRVAADWAMFAQRLQGPARAQFLVNGAAPAPGTRFRAPGQAEVLRRIARDGRSAFYEGHVAADMLAALDGAPHTAEDFAATRSDWGTPISGTYGDWEVLEHAPNGTGAAALLLLDILKAFDLPAMDPFGTERAHIEAEATKLAYDARNRFIADLAHMPDPGRLQRPGLGASLASLIDPSRAMGDVAPLTEEMHKHTICLTIVDRDRMVVSLIYSIFDDFGSGISSPEYGILFHNRGSGFNLIPGHANEYGPGKRPMHTILPGMVRRNGEVTMPFCVMGGPYQATGHARLITNLVAYGMELQDALDGPRAFADIAKGALFVERGYDRAVFDGLAALGQNVQEAPQPIGGAQAIRLDLAEGLLVGASDPRKDGIALGY